VSFVLLIVDLRVTVGLGALALVHVVVQASLMDYVLTGM
jgi:hypothetical protein